MLRLTPYSLALVLLLGIVSMPASQPSAHLASRLNGDQTHPWIMQEAAAAADQPASVAKLYYGADSPHPAVIPLMRAPTPLQREVLGFVNASNLGDPSVGYTSWNFALLSTVVFFGIQVNSGDGHLVSTNTGWSVYHSSTMTGLVNTAHANGVKVLVSLNLHDFSTSPTNQVCQGLVAANTQSTISEILTEVANAGIDGVSIDYEGQDTVCANGLTERQQLVSFVQNMRAAMPKGMYLSIDTYSGSAEDNLEFFDITGLAPYVDSFFVMAYDMDYDNSTQPPLNCTAYCFNPVSPLNTYRFNVTKSMSQYLALVPASKVILGQPYYGRRGCVPNLTDAHQYRIPNSNFVAPTYIYASTIPTQTGVFSFTAHRDPGDGVSEWDTWYDSDWTCNREQYFDDAYSLGTKYDVVNADNLRGVGLFTLDYGGSSPELWNELAAKFTTLTPWTSLGGSASSSPGSSSGATNHLDMFVRGSDFGLYQKTWDGTAWSNWVSIGGLLTSAPSAASWGPNRTDVFVRGSDNQLYQKDLGWDRLVGLGTARRHLDLWAGGRDLGQPAAGCLRARHRQRPVAQVVGSHRVVGVAAPGRIPDVGSRRCVVGLQPHRRVRARKRRRSLSQVLGRHRLVELGGPRRGPDGRTGRRLVRHRSRRRVRDRNRPRSVAERLERQRLERLAAAGREICGQSIRHLPARCNLGSRLRGRRRRRGLADRGAGFVGGGRAGAPPISE